MTGGRGGLLFDDGPTACPFLALDRDRERRADEPDTRHRCYATPTPEPRALAHQRSYCLTANFSACPIFQDWAIRSAARPVPLRPIPPALALSADDSRPVGEPEFAPPPEMAEGATYEPEQVVLFDETPPKSGCPGRRAADADVQADCAAEEGGGRRTKRGRTTRHHPAAEQAISAGHTAVIGADDAAYVHGGDAADAACATQALAVEADQAAQVTAAPGGHRSCVGTQPLRRAGPGPIVEAQQWRARPVLVVDGRVQHPGRRDACRHRSAHAARALWRQAGRRDANANARRRRVAHAGWLITIGRSVACLDWQTYTIALGDSLYGIATKFNVTYDQLLAANPQITNPDFIVVGQVINIPPPSYVAPTPTAAPTAEPTPTVTPKPTKKR